MLLLIDNYDSFVFNLARYFAEMEVEVRVVRNDAITVAEIAALGPEGIVLSPGPCTPDEAGVCLEVVERFAGAMPILGVCLGHQVIAQALGGRVIRAAEPVHGRVSPVLHDGTGLFTGVGNPCVATRYHSLVVEESSLPGELTVFARLEDGTVMGVAHREQPVFGVQFHPESVLTRDGHRVLGNFLDVAGIAYAAVDSTEADTLETGVDWWALTPDSSGRGG